MFLIIHLGVVACPHSPVHETVDGNGTVGNSVNPQPRGQPKLPME